MWTHNVQNTISSSLMCAYLGGNAKEPGTLLTIEQVGSLMGGNYQPFRYQLKESKY